MLYDDNKFEKESVWKKKGFYLSLCTGLICVMAIGVVYYRMNYPSPDSNSSSKLASESISTPETDAVGNGALSAQNDLDSDAGSKTADKSEINGQSQEANSGSTQNTGENKKAADDTKTQTAGKGKKAEQKKQEKKDSMEVMSNTGGSKLSFNEEAGLLWPVHGDVIMKYSMSNTVYFKTLAQYKCNPAIEIAAKEGTKVSAASDGVVTGVSENEETGKTVSMEIGDNYTVVYGQLKNIQVKKGQSVKEGDSIGNIATPTKYFSEEGSNLYFQVLENNKTVDPLLLLR